MNKGIIFALITAGISGVSIFYNRVVVVSGIDPLIFNIIKNGGVAIVFSFILLTTQYRKQLLSLSIQSWIRLLAIGGIGGSIPFVLFFEGLKLMPAVQANLIHKTLFIWVAILAVPILKERLSKMQVLAYGGIAIATFFVGGIPVFSGSRGELMILAATLLWAIENIIAKQTLRSVPSTIVAWSRMAIGCLLLVLLAVIQNKLAMITLVSPQAYLAILGSIGLLSGYVYFWYKGLALAPATLVSSILVISTPVTLVLSTRMLSQPVSLPIIFSNLIVVAAVGVMVWSRKETA